MAANVDKSEGKGSGIGLQRERAVEGSGFGGEPVDKWGKLCRTAGKCSTWNIGCGIGLADWVHVPRGTRVGEGNGAFHVELLGGLPGQQDPLVGGRKADDGAGARGQEGKGACMLRLPDKDGEAPAGGDQAGGGHEGLV